MYADLPLLYRQIYFCDSNPWRPIRMEQVRVALRTLCLNCFLCFLCIFSKLLFLVFPIGGPGVSGQTPLGHYLACSLRGH